VATGRVTVREGETLSEIAARQGMGMGQLMALNGISKADHVEVGQVLKVTGKPAVAAPSYRRGASVHVVRPGESLSEIAEGYGLSMNRLVAINQIDDPNHVEIGRQLKLKGEAPAPRPVAAAPVARPKPSPVAAAPQPRPATPRPAALEDSTPAPAVVSATTIAARPAVRTTPETGGAVSRATEAASLAARPSTPAVATTPVATTTAVQATAAAPRPISTAMASPAPRPATLSPAARPAATTVATASGMPSAPAAASSAAWRRYGPLRVDWSNWQPMGGSLVAPILNAKGDTLYLAINCGARKMNATSVAGDWRTWDNPQADFELKLVNDLCRSRG
jgi:LysM repeat protein